MKKSIKRYFYFLVLGFDQFVNVILGGYPDETISSRSYRKALTGSLFWILMRKFIDFLALFFNDINHCYEAYQNELKGIQCPSEFRKELHEIFLDEDQETI